VVLRVFQSLFMHSYAQYIPTIQYALQAMSSNRLGGSVAVLLQNANADESTALKVVDDSGFLLFCDMWTQGLVPTGAPFAFAVRFFAHGTERRVWPRKVVLTSRLSLDATGCVSHSATCIP
jgi:hypothetical protein